MTNDNFNVNWEELQKKFNESKQSQTTGGLGQLDTQNQGIAGHSHYRFGYGPGNCPSCGYCSCCGRGGYRPYYGPYFYSY